MTQSIWFLAITVVGNRTTIHLWIFPSNLLKIPVMCPWDLGSGCLCPAEWGWTEGRDEVWCSCNKGLRDAWGGLLLGRSIRVVSNCINGSDTLCCLISWSLDAGCPWQGMLPWLRGCVLCLTVVSTDGLSWELWDGHDPAAGQRVLTGGYGKELGGVPTPTTGPGCPGGCLVGVSDTGELTSAERVLMDDGRWKGTNQYILSFLSPVAAATWFLRSSRERCIGWKGVTGLVRPPCLHCPLFSTSFPFLPVTHKSIPLHQNISTVSFALTPVS